MLLYGSGGAATAGKGKHNHHVVIIPTNFRNSIIITVVVSLCVSFFYLPFVLLLLSLSVSDGI